MAGLLLKSRQGCWLARDRAPRPLFSGALTWDRPSAPGDSTLQQPALRRLELLPEPSDPMRGAGGEGPPGGQGGKEAWRERRWNGEPVVWRRKDALGWLHAPRAASFLLHSPAGDCRKFLVAP